VIIAQKKEELVDGQGQDWSLDKFQELGYNLPQFHDNAWWAMVVHS
jgi:hypothetical protein